MTIQRRGTQQPGVRAEELPGKSFEIVGDPHEMEAAAFTGTQRRRPVGFLTHDPQRGHVDTIFVSQQFRGKGIGRRMYEAAGEPPYSPVLTEQGLGFGKAVGAKMPESIPAKREAPLNEPGHEAMLPDFTSWISESPHARRVQ